MSSNLGRNGFGYADEHSYNATSSMGVDFAGLRANLDQLASGELQRSPQPPTWRASQSTQVERNPISSRFDPVYDEDEEARRPIISGGQHRLISNYGTSWVHEGSATSRPALEVPRVSSPPPRPAFDNTVKKSKTKEERGGDRKLAGESSEHAEGQHIAQEEAEEEAASSVAYSPREDEHVVQEGETLNGLALHLDTTTRVLKRLNKLTGDSLYAGQVLKIPMMRKQFSEAVEVEEEVGPQDGELVEVIDKNGFSRQVWRKKSPKKKTPPKNGGQQLAATHLTGFFEPR